MKFLKIVGSNIRSSEMPAEQLAAFFRIFNEFNKQKVLWKWEDDTVKMPKNVFVKSWLPQNDILAHPNVKVFITHGGLLGTQEGVYHGVPLLGIPVYFDQHLNIKKASKAGYAVSIKFPNVTDVSLRWALNELLYNPKYVSKAKEVSQIFRDRPLSAKDSVVYWVDYIIRYKGATHLRSSAINISWFSYFLLDIIGSALFGVIGIWLLFRILITCLIGKEKQKSHKTPNKKYM